MAAYRLTSFAGLALLLLAGHALAGPAADPPTAASALQPAAQAAPTADRPAPAPDPTASGPALSIDEMGAITGSGDPTVTTLSLQQLTGTTTDNSITVGVMTTGGVNFDPTSLNNFNGIGNFVINTGANNTLQGAISISITTAAPTP